MSVHLKGYSSGAAGQFVVAADCCPTRRVPSEGRQVKKDGCTFNVIDIEFVGLSLAHAGFVSIFTRVDK